MAVLKDINMNVYSVKRKIDGLTFCKDEDRVSAETWADAETELFLGKASGRFDDTCYIDGEIIYEEWISDDSLLDIINSMK